MNAIPEKLCGYNVYNSGEKLVGVGAETVLPKLEPITTEISGAGILGTYESINPGHFGSLETELAWRNVSKEAAKLMEPRVQTIILRGDQNSYDIAEGDVRHQALKVVIRGMPKNIEPGKFKAGDPTETKINFEILYLKIELADEVIVEVDKLNYIYIVNGIDYLAEVRNNI